MSATEDFLSTTEEREIVDAIVKAEQQTSGEIRVHIEEHSHLPALERAQEVFKTLNMHKTSARNGVLFYIGVKDRHFAIIGDDGIDKVVPYDFWESTKKVVIDQFKQNQFKEGLIQGILQTGKQLKFFFPYQGKDDVNELPNEISRS
ncbi:TPM domain-containing protein [Flavobacterium sp. xlx-214]|uniref:TPM domain-containing protein n=1 Tax=unclassified Flavobacterium TaxID=196869 RepID=UPI0013D6AE1B|nr:MULTISPECIES: TPM domain-containing protein [unclassified Flavobacterium]MBA5793392.1 TPM domain-containing protein [Flavobacterium sp. xlx-221]QMI84048.1 TPM domain-containing protein [Flavobacterium sp. xlx-214]